MLHREPRHLLVSQELFIEQPATTTCSGLVEHDSSIQTKLKLPSH